jgi:hypothetical protein
MATSHDGHEQDRKYQQYLNTSLNAAKASFPSPEAKAQRTTADVLHGTSPNETRQRIDTAVQAYQTLKDKSFASLTPQQKYQHELGRGVSRINKQQLALQDWERLAAIDKKIGVQLIRHHGVTEKGLTHTLEKHSPAASKYPHGKEEYAVGMAKICDEEAQQPRERKPDGKEAKMLTEVQQMQMIKDLHRER